MRDSIIKIVRQNTEKGKRIFRFYLFFIAIIITLSSVWGFFGIKTDPPIEKIIINYVEDDDINEYFESQNMVCGIDFSSYRIDPEKIYVEDDEYLYKLSDNYIARLTLRSDVQKILKKNMDIYNIPFVAAVVMEASTGKIVGLYEKKSDGSPYSIFKTYKAASIFKVITMETLLSEKNISTDEKMCYHGGKRSLNRNHLIENPRKDYRCMEIDRALGFSANVIFARLAYRYLDREILSDHITRFGFGEILPVEFNVEKSHIIIPMEREELAYTAAGFGETYISPIHGAVITSIVANNGVYIKPTLINEILDANENVLYSHSRIELRTVFSEDVASKLKKMMRVTVSEGTAHKFFARKRPIDFVKEIPLAGKTGSIADRGSKYTEYNWFVGFAPVDKPEYVISVLSINSENISARATLYARHILDDLFKDTKKISVYRSHKKKIIGKR